MKTRQIPVPIGSMLAMARTRQRTIIYPGGTYSSKQPSFPPQTFANTNSIYVDRCVDDVGRKTDHALNITKVQYTGLSPLNGFKIPVLDAFWKYSDFWPTTWSGAHSHVLLDTPSISTQITKVLARTNPTRPVVSLPVLLYELKDLPEMIRDIGRIKLYWQNRKHLGIKPTSRFLASSQLSVQMGWAPLLSDLLKLIGFTEQVDRRVDELRRVYNNGGLKRRLQMGNYAGQGLPETTTLANHFETIGAKFTKSTTVVDWATVRWLPALGTKLPSDSKVLRSTARDIVLGFHAGASNLWEAIPWSWLIDWSLNVGDYLKATNNSQLFNAKPVNYMRYTRTEANYVRTDSSSWVGGGHGVHITESKTRTVGSATLTASLPFLNERQLSILGALAIQRIR